LIKAAKTDPNFLSKSQKRVLAQIDDAILPETIQDYRWTINVELMKSEQEMVSEYHQDKLQDSIKSDKARTEISSQESHREG
jgi:hypothetical protein